MECKLCKKDRQLANSHIIPEFLYKPLYNDKHQYFVLSTSEQKCKQKEQKGIREKMLCLDCEQHISRYEKYASNVMFGHAPVGFRNERSRTLMSQIDYRLFKLFQLSVLWRASASEHKMFTNVDLGPHENIIRQMILTDEPGEENKYCCVMIALKYEADLVLDLIYQPEKRRIDGHVVYRFIFGSIMWVYFVTSHRIPESLSPFFLTKSGSLRMEAPKDIGAIPFVKEFAKEARRVGRLPDGIA